MLLFYIRHGDPIYDPDSLTPLGERQAEAVGRRLATFGVDKIFASSSNRAQLTAKPTCEMLKTEPVILEFCREKYAYKDFSVPYGDEGKRHWCFQDPAYRKLFNSPEVRALGDAWYRHPAFAETKFEAGIKRIREETDALLSGFGYEHDAETNGYNAINPNDDRIALFAHQGFGLAFLSVVLDIPYPLFVSHFDMGHSGMTVIEFENKTGWLSPTVLQFSNDGHLWRDGIPTNYQNRVRF